MHVATTVRVASHMRVLLRIHPLSISHKHYQGHAHLFQACKWCELVSGEHSRIWSDEQMGSGTITRLPSAVHIAALALRMRRWRGLG